MWERYWREMEALIESGLCDIAAHFDLPKKPGFPMPDDQMDHAIHIIDQIHNKGMVLEVNTGGIDRSADRKTYPSLTILRLAREKGVDITLGSDARCPAEVGRHFPETIQTLCSMGWNRVAVFQKRMKTFIPFLSNGAL